MSVLLKLNIRKLLKVPLIAKVNTSSKVVVVVNMVTFGSNSNLTQAKALNSLMPLSVVRFQRNTLSQHKMV